MPGPLYKKHCPEVFYGHIHRIDFFVSEKIITSLRFCRSFSKAGNRTEPDLDNGAADEDPNRKTACRVHQNAHGMQKRKDQIIVDLPPGPVKGKGQTGRS
jgi:hypothetical protein